MTRILRQYQVEAIEAVRAEWERGVVRTSVVLATGLVIAAGAGAWAWLASRY